LAGFTPPHTSIHHSPRTAAVFLVALGDFPDGLSLNLDNFLLLVSSLAHKTPLK
jgi:hypothetical protein